MVFWPGQLKMSSENPVYSVKQINAYIKRMLDEDSILRDVSVKGEISNCKYHFSGHIYFSLKDDSGVIRCVMFASNAASLTFTLKDGMQVTVRGNVSSYERGGTYQLYARRIEKQGVGDLYAKYEELKEKLSEMGMFSEVYKKTIPRFAWNIGVVTSGTGAVIRDIYNVASRRNPYCQIKLCPAQVQGEGAADSIIKGIKTLDRMGLDVIIIGRGGGSMEDLWCFNDEKLARAIFECETPVISAVGHETDFTIADFVADLRAPTPSAAAELAVFDYYSFVSGLDAYKSACSRAMKKKLDLVYDRLGSRKKLLESLSPAEKTKAYSSRVGEYSEKLKSIIGSCIKDKNNALQMRRMDLDSQMEKKVSTARHRLSLTAAKLEGLSPLTRLSEGYAYVEIPGKGMLRTVDTVKPGDMIDISICDGTISATAEKIIKKANGNG